MKQAILPIQSIVSEACDLLNVTYGGIDASINPGLSIPDSVGAGLENLLFFPEKATSSMPPIPAQQFGTFHRNFFIQYKIARIGMANGQSIVLCSLNKLLDFLTLSIKLRFLQFCPIYSMLLRRIWYLGSSISSNKCCKKLVVQWCQTYWL